MDRKALRTKTKIILTSITVFFLVIVAFTGKVLASEKIAAKISVLKDDQQNFERLVSKLLLGEKEKEYETLLDEYNTLIEEKDFKNIEPFKSIIYEFIATVEKDNLEELKVKIEAFEKIDTSLLEDAVIKEKEEKLTSINNLISEKEYKTAIEKIDEFIEYIEKIIEEKKEALAEEQRILEEEQRRKQEEEDSKKLEESNNSVEEENNTGDNSSSDGGDSLSNNLYGDETVESYISKSPTAQYTDQIVAVVGSGASAQVYLLEKENGIWNTVLQTSGLVGSQGIGQASEYVSRTPKGSYGLGFAFGTGENPGTILSYRQITNDSYWISDVNSPYYNTWQEGDFAGNGNEHLIEFPTQYRYGITLNYDNGVGGGSAFFLHCSNGSPTAGCISVPSDIMLTLMQRIHGGAYIINVNYLSELANY